MRLVSKKLTIALLFLGLSGINTVSFASCLYSYQKCLNFCSSHYEMGTPALKGCKTSCKAEYLGCKSREKWRKSIAPKIKEKWQATKDWFRGFFHR